MNAGLTLAMIISMLLAIPGSGNPDVARKQKLQDQKQELLDNKDDTTGTFFGARIGSNCSPLVCGSNHNETIVRDAPSQIDSWSLWLTPDQAAVVAPVLIQLSKIGGGCSPMVCGVNHNETLVTDAS